MSTPKDIDGTLTLLKEAIDSGTVGAQKRTELESQLWDYAKPKLLPGTSRGPWLSKHLGGHAGEYEARYFLSRCMWVDPIWQLIDEKRLVARTGVKLVKRGRTIAEKLDCSIADGIGHAIKEYLSLPSYKTESGQELHREFTPRTSKKGKQKDALPAEETTEEPAEAAEEPAEEASAKPEPEPEQAAPKAPSKSKKPRVPPGSTPEVAECWENIRKEIDKLLDMKLEGVDMTLASSLRADFMSELAAMFSQFRSTMWVKTKRAKEGAVELSRKEVIDACRTLCMDPPKPGKPIDLAKAKSQYKKLVHAYHPDTHNGDESTRPQYEAVLAAMASLKKHAKTQGEKKP